MKPFKLIPIILLFIFLAGFSQAEVKFPSPNGFVNDYAGILSAAQKQQLTAILNTLKKNSGAELAVVTVKTVEPLDSKMYAVKLFEKWGIGQKDKDNGLLVLLAIKEKRIEIEVGYGLEGDIPDALAGRILDTYAIPYFKEGNFAQGLIETAKALSKAVAKEELALAAPQKTQPPPKSAGVYLIYIIIGVIVLGVVFRRTGSIIMGILGAVWGSGSAGIAGAIIGGLLGLFFGFWGLMFLGRGGGLGGGIGRGFGGGRSGGGGAGRGW